MIFDSYAHFRDNPQYNKFVDKDYLIVEFKCPIEAENFKSWSQCHYITYVLSGRKKWLTPEREWNLTAGESIFVHKGAYLNRQYFEEDFCVLMFFMTDRFIKNFVLSDLEQGIHLDPAGPDDCDLIETIEVSETLENLYHSFFGYLRQKDRIPKKIIELKFREMVLNIMSNPSNGRVTSAILNIARNDGLSLEKVMEENFLYNLSLEEFARLAGKSLSSFKRDFQSAFNSTPGRWLTGRRLEHARQLLLGTGLTVKEICFDTGFENPSHFTNAFRKRFGQTPNQYRKMEKATA
ncbi:AraC family transcriptional regulator [Robiginitalea sp. SC105]|uniref:AraC family transcriptional regulator n=1 Tax=Robiginitalea sp. SC105 TaxID=2762332 RepID=UPI00163A72A2|nr:AraC family transcriptional regulator [Robiginitalea sp. SC105]MBC2840419.1 helix-turn-helix transcriptional regulator [Robiginitalea sp. SC105]